MAHEKLETSVEQNIMVSIWCQTYNQKDYIRDALEGFVSQKTDFAFEVIVYDDASTDGTSDIVREYADRYPQMFRIWIAEENIFWSPEKQKEFRRKQWTYCRGKYIGLCEGDDYWIDCNKLQIQVNYMESHPNCAMYLHNALRLDCRTSKLETINPYVCNEGKNLSPEEVIMLYKGHPPTASILVRGDVMEWPEFVVMTSGGDYATELYALLKGKIFYDSRIMSIYRSFREGSYTDIIADNKESAFRFYIEMTCFLLEYDKYSNYQYHVWITNRIQVYASWFVHDIESDERIREIYSNCKTKGYLSEPIYDKCFEMIACLRQQTLRKEYCSSDVKEFVNKHKIILVMGIGEYSSILTEQFENNNIHFAGYVVSHKNDDHVNEFKGKPVWTFAELPFSKADVGIVIAINPRNWENITHSLADAKIANYYCPFLLDKDTDCAYL